jgi:hypothetical protein
MICPICHAPLPDGARFCHECGETVTAYAPPEGFEIDPESLLYLRDDGMDADGTQRSLTWFDPDTGEYRQESLPVTAYAPPEGFELDPESLLYLRDDGLDADGTQRSLTWFDPDTGEYRQENRTVTKYAPPEGFELDPESRLYLRDDGTDESGTQHRLTWFDPDTGEYRQESRPIQTARRPVPAPPPPPLPGTAPGQSPQPIRDNTPPGYESPKRRVPTREKKKISILLVILPLIILLGGGVFALARLGLLPFGESNEVAAIPEGIETSPANPDAASSLEPADGDNAGDRDEDNGGNSGESEADSRTESTAESTAPSSMPDESGETGAFNWAALYLDYIASRGYTFGEYLFFQDVGTFPIDAVNGTNRAIAEICFYELPEFDYPVMFEVEYLEFQNDPRGLDTTHAMIPYLIKNGEVTGEITSAERDVLFEVAEESGMSFVNGEVFAVFTLFVNYTGSEGREMVDANFGDLFAWLDGQAAQVYLSEEQAAAEPASEQPAPVERAEPAEGEAIPEEYAEYWEKAQADGYTWQEFKEMMGLA